MNELCTEQGFATGGVELFPRRRRRVRTRPDAIDNVRGSSNGQHHSMNAGTLVLGLLNGLTYGLLAVGLVLVYKSNRFINLAHAQMGTLSAMLLAKFVLDWHWSWWAAFVVSVAVGLVTGVAVERLLVRPLRRKTNSPVALLLLTIGVSQLLLALTYIPDLGPNQSHGSHYPQPFVSHIRIGHVVLTGTYVLTMFLVPALVVALALF